MAASDTLASSGDEETQNNASTSDDLSAEDSDEEADSSGAAAEPRAAAVRGSRRRQLTTSASVPMFEHGGGVSDCSDTEVTELGGSEADLMRMEEGPLALQLSQVNHLKWWIYGELSMLDTFSPMRGTTGAPPGTRCSSWRVTTTPPATTSPSPPSG